MDGEGKKEKECETKEGEKQGWGDIVRRKVIKRERRKREVSRRRGG